LKEDPLGGQKVELKIPKEIPSDSLQNPSDPDATYSGHKGQGYQAQVTETFTKTEDEEEKAKTLNLITNIEVEPASDSDADAFIPNMNSIIDRGLGPKEIQADSLYGSDKNHQAFIADGIDLVAPTMGTTAKGKFSLSDFSLSDDGQIMECPQGQAPELKKRKKGRLIQGFHLDICMNCPHLEICPVKPGKKYAYYRYSAKSARIANRRQYEQTDEFKSRYRWRAGVEATMSELDRRTSFKNLRYRGMKAIRFAATMKAVGINIVRATAARKAISYA
jgi:hypothetical protein